MRALMFCLSISSALFAASAPADESVPLCAGWENGIAEDMRIQESDLTHDRAQKALDSLRDAAPKTGFMEWAVLNAAKIVQGYALRQVALTSNSTEATDAFCRWLVKEGFWYD